MTLAPAQEMSCIYLLIKVVLFRLFALVFLDWNLNFHFTEKVKGITLMCKLQYDPFKYELNMNNLNVGLLRVPIIFVNGHIVHLLILLPVMLIISIITSFHTFSLYFTYLCLFWSWAGPTSLLVWPFCLYRSLKNVKKICEDCPGL